MNWGWHRQKEVLKTDKATQAESRLAAIKKAAKQLKKGVDDSLKTAPKKPPNDDLDLRKRRTGEFAFGETLTLASKALETDPIAMRVSLSQHCTCSPLYSVLERFANIEKTIGIMLATNESEIFTFASSDTPIARLLAEDIPAVGNAKKDLDALMRRQESSQGTLEKEYKKLERLKSAAEEDTDMEALKSQQEKYDRLSFELESLTKEVSMEQDKLTSTLLTLVSRENRYAESVLHLIRLKKQFYENAFKTMEAELPLIEKMLQETTMRSVFGERLEDHLRATNRTIAFPIALSIRYMLESGLNDEGLFRISPKQIKLEKMKAHIDSQHFEDLGDLLADSDAHLHSALLKCYLRELPVALLGDERTYARWIKANSIRDAGSKIAEFRSILSPAGQELSAAGVRNVQYVIKFLSELSKKSETTKMTQRNIAIVLAPTLLRQGDKGPKPEDSECIIDIVDNLIQKYHTIFPIDIDLRLREEGLDAMALQGANGSPITAPIRKKSMAFDRQSRSKSPTSALRRDGIIGSAVASTVANAGAVAATGRNSCDDTGANPVYTPPSPGGGSHQSSRASMSSMTGVSLAVESPSPRHKRKPSVRAMGKNFMEKVEKGKNFMAQAAATHAVGSGGHGSRGSSADGAHIQPDHNSA